jgi:hypothetical protein
MTPPVTTATVVSGVLGKNGYYVTPITVDLTASDPDSPNGLETFYKIDKSAFVEGTSFRLGDGIHTVQFYSQDQSGNKEVVQTDVFKIDATVPMVTAMANPTSLWPPNHKFVPVTVSGHVTDASGGVPSMVSYRVVDSYGQVQPSGTAVVHANGNYSFVVMLQASRLGQDKAGRNYSIIVTATDEAGNTGSARTSVVVPHDQGHGSSSAVVIPNNNHGHGNSGGASNGHGHGHGHG